MRISKTLLKAFLSTSLGDAFFTLKKNTFIGDEDIPYKIKNNFSKSEIDALTNMSIINEGIKIGSLAKQYWTNWAETNNYKVLDMPDYGIVAKEYKSYDDYINHCIKITNDAITGDDSVVIFEAAFELKYKNLDNSTQIRTDVLIYDANKKAVDLIEVKAVNKPKGEHYYDVLFQQYILTKLDIKVNSSRLQFLNSKYQREGDINLDELFRVEEYFYLSNFSRPIFEYSEKTNRIIVNYSNSVSTLEEWPTYIMTLKNGGTRKRSKLKNELVEFKIKHLGLDQSLGKDALIEEAFKPFKLVDLNLFYYERFEYFIPILDKISNMFSEGSELLDIIEVMDEYPDIKNRQASALFNDDIKKIYKEAFWYISEYSETNESRKYLPIDKNDSNFINKIVSFIKEEQQKQIEIQNKLLSSEFDPTSPTNLGTIENLYRARATQKSDIRYFLDLNYLNELDPSVSRVGTSNIQKNQKLQIEAHKNWSILRNDYRISRVLKKYTTPIYMVDFETVASSIPVIDKATPYQQVPFQYSLHVITSSDLEEFDKTGTFNREKIYHSEYLADSSDANFSDTFANKLFDDLTKFGKGTYVAYNKSFEKTVLKKLSENNELREEVDALFAEVRESMEDLMDFYKFKDSDQDKSEIIYYDPRMNGSFSIKKTLPTIDNTFSYKKDLEEIHNGSEALDAFKRRMNGEISDSDWEKTSKNLLAYCEQDTWSMIKIYEYFYNLVKEVKND